MANKPVVPVEAQPASLSTKEEPTKTSKTEEYDKNELMKILDQVVFEGQYTEELNIKGRLKVTFRTRTADEVTSISKELDALDYKLIQTVMEQRAMQNLAYSLIEYNGKDLRNIKPIPEKLKLIGQLPIVVVSALSTALTRFDEKVNTACSEKENF